MIHPSASSASSDSSRLLLEPGRVPLSTWRRLWAAPAAVALPEAAWGPVRASAAAVSALLAHGQPAYGINTGFGKLAHTHIPDDQLALLQRNLILSHAVGTGEELADPVVRLVLATKAASLARGHSGVRPVVIETLLGLLDAGISPCIPAKGSVGASGDLAPLAHMTLALMGEGEVRVEGVRRPAAQALREAGLRPLTLAPKEGLALINGTQVSTALALHGLFMAQRVLEAAVAVGALSVDAARGSDAPFDERIHAVRGQPGQIALARAYRTLLAGSAIRRSHLVADERVQDPYSLRCQPQVIGACRDLLLQAARTLRVEANAVTDNPLLFGEQALSGGNFHAEPVAFAADQMALAIAEIGALAERRIALLIDANLSGLPPFLVRDAGLNSGFMIAHVTAAALASENKSLAHPASVDSLPTSANQEDHVSMATFAARRLQEMALNSASIVAIEWLTAAQGVDFHQPLTTSAPLQALHALLRGVVAHYDRDRLLAPDIEAARALLLQGEISRTLPDTLGALWED